MKPFITFLFISFACNQAFSQNYNWAFGIGNSGNETCNSIDHDASGNIYVAGAFEGSCDFNPLPNQNLTLNSSGNKDIYMAKYDPQGNVIWAVRMGASGIDEAKFIRVNPANGDIYLAGTFQNSVDFDFGSPSAVLTSAGIYDIFFARYSSNGVLLGARRLGGVNIELLDAMDINTGSGNNGDITLMGRFTGTVDFDPSSAVVNLVANGSESFIARYNVSLAYLNAYKFGAGSVYGKSLSYNNNGSELYVTGGFNGTVDFDFGSSTNNISAVSGNTDIFLAKYNSQLNHQWAVSMGGTSGAKEGRSVATDANGDVLLTGAYAGSVDLDPSSSSAVYTSANTNSDIFLAKYSNSGLYQWGNVMGGNGTDYGNALCSDASGNIYACGVFQSTVDFDPSSANSDLVSGGGDDAFFARYSATGQFQFAKGLGGNGNQSANAALLTGADNYYLCGLNAGSGADFDPGSGNVIISSLGGTDAFVGKYKSCPDPQIATSQASSNNPCANTTFTLTLISGFLGGASDWHWYSGSCGGMAVGTGTQIVTTVSATTDFYVRAEGGCLSSPGVCSSQNNITPMPLPTISVLSSNTLICNGGSVTLNFSGAGNYTLNPGNLTGSSLIIYPSATTIYTITGQSGCSNTSLYTQQVMECTSISETSANGEYSVFPNPSEGQVYIMGTGEESIVLTNQLGQKITFASEELPGGIKLSGLEPGVYFVYCKQGFTKLVIATTK